MEGESADFHETGDGRSFSFFKRSTRGRLVLGRQKTGWAFLFSSPFLRAQFASAKE